MISQTQFLSKIQQINSKEQAENILFLVYPTDNLSSDNFFHSSGIEDLDWNSFYAVREIEEKYGMSCYVSSYLATALAYPKISLYYSEIASHCHQEKSDFCSRVYEMTMRELIPKWDKTKNDNFWAYMQPNLLTVRNAILAEDGGPSKYMKEKKGMSMVSMEALKEKSEAGWDTPDEEMNTEDAALANMERDRKELLKKIVGLGKQTLANSENIWNSIVCQKLFHSPEEDELEILNDNAIVSVLNLYFDAIEDGIIENPNYNKSKVEEEEEEFIFE